jgi:hypothetical protein
LEQILVLFNPSLEIQTTDNFIDWTSLSTVELVQMTFSNRSIPIGTNTNIDIATLTLDAPIYLSPPVKIKQLGVITDIISNVIQGIDNVPTSDLQSEFGSELYPSGSSKSSISGSVGSGGSLLNIVRTALGGFTILVINGQAQILNPSTHLTASNTSLEIPQTSDTPVNWRVLFEQNPGKYKAGYSKIYLKQNDFTEVIGTIGLNALDETYITINYDTDTFPTNTEISSVYRPGSPGTFDAIIDPTRVGPGHGIAAATTGARYLIIEDTGDSGNAENPAAWGGLVASENDIIEYNGTNWIVVFDASQSQDQLIYQTNIYTGVQYKWNGQSWVKSFEGEYRAGTWRLEL